MFAPPPPPIAPAGDPHGDAHRSAGWYGKLPSLGDFASRRLAPDLMEPWDQWLASGLAHWQELEPDDWLHRYQNGVSCRFLLLPGVWPGLEQPVLGAMMPAADSVGRQFPLTLMQPLAQWPQNAAQTAALLLWQQQLSDLGEDAIERAWSVTHLEAQLHALGAATHAFGAPAPGGAPMVWNVRDFAGELLQQHCASAQIDPLESDSIENGSAIWLGNDSRGVPTWRRYTGAPAPGLLRLLMSAA